MTHTPGPWEALNETGRAGFIVQAETHDFIADVMQMNDDGPANARLIAAAPELLAACETALLNLTPLYVSDHLVVKRLRAAIAAATTNHERKPNYV